PSVQGSYSISYSYTDLGTGCSNTASTTISVAAPASSYTTACTNTVPYLFSGQFFSTTGLHTVPLPNSNGCTDTAKLYLVVKQAVDIDTAGCDSLIYEGGTYHNDTVIVQTVSSVITTCDSIVKSIRIRVKKSTINDTTICLPVNGSLTMLAQTFTTTGHYILHTVNTQGCDSLIRLHLTVATLQISDKTGCDSVGYNGTYYTENTIITEIIPSVTSGCDSVFKTTNIYVKKKTTSFTVACINSGETYIFNTMPYTSSGIYTSTLINSQGCDSLAQLYLVATTRQTVNITSCHPVAYNGITYTTSTTLQNRIPSVVLPCDSVWQTINIVITTALHSYKTACINQGESYIFNGQSLSATGTYTAAYNSNGCDSIVHLYLLVAVIKTQMISGCGSVFYNGTSYTSPAVISDTVQSVVTSCDSIINVVRIQVNQQPAIQISNNATICKGDSIRLGAMSNTGSVNWLGFGQTDSITVRPLVTSTYTAVANDANGCTNNSSVTVFIQDFRLEVYATPPSALSGQPLFLQTASTLPYYITAWHPSALFTNPKAKTQNLIADSSLQIIVTGQSALGCKDTASASLIITPLDKVYVPSGFTPNGDGKNEIAKVAGTGIKELDFKIFNRWGQIIFYTKDKTKGWDGKLAGMLQPAGTYVYVVKVKKTNGQVMEKKGTVTLIR
ncbi:MAG TPA: gliding motility-associated C-terminal domain-containing protein, partial [Flavisolibacter sp.]|nr:gliding motility-associated C-terminal domain-containing protein [Flavisolibacter sp.]